MKKYADYYRKYYKDNKENILKKQKKYNSENKAKINEYMKAYYHKRKVSKS